MKPLALVISCEHAVNTIPPAFAPLFRDQHVQLNSHWGFDLGALNMARYLNQHLPSAYYATASVSRLLIDCNRSLTHRQCFSSITKNLSAEEKQRVIDCYYQPFRQNIIHAMDQLISEQRCILHLSIHSFTSSLNGKIRELDLGLLYDPKRASEHAWVRHWQQLLRHHAPQLRVRRNAPYRGTSDGLTKALRQRYINSDYIGIEIESSETFSASPDKHLLMCELLTQTLRSMFTTVPRFD